MVTDDQENVPCSTGRFEAGCCPPFQARSRTFQVAAMTLAFVSLWATGFLALRWLRPTETTDAAGPAPAAKRYFLDWPKPDVVLLLTGEQHGYNQPCGCSRPQQGGLERRFNMLQHFLKERGWPIVAVDLGDIAQRTGPQAKLKYKYSMEALKRLNYTAVGVGLNEMGMPLLDALAEFALNEPQPAVLAANLQNKVDKFVGVVKSSEVSGGKTSELKVGVIGVVAPSVAKQVKDSDVKFDAIEQALPVALKEVQAKKPELLVLLFQGSTSEARECAAKFPQFHVILTLTREEEPSGKPERVGNTLITGVGHKGRFLGIVGVFRTGSADQPFDLKYELVPVEEKYETPAGKDKENPVLVLLEEYTREVKKGNYLAHYSKMKHPIQLDAEFAESTYVGSAKCKSCHKISYKIWEKTPHSHAYQTLVDAKRPSLRQFDGECIVCHVTGFGYTGGFRNETDTAHLKDVGCESCHGPASLHVKNPHNPRLNAYMNPFKPPPKETPEHRVRRMNQLDQSCQKCHDIDNDVNWTIKKWDKIVHPEPKEPEQ